MCLKPIVTVVKKRWVKLFIVLDAEGSSQILLPTINLERALINLHDKESTAVLLCLQYEQCAGPQKQEVINECALSSFGNK